MLISKVTAISRTDISVREKMPNFVIELKLRKLLFKRRLGAFALEIPALQIFFRR